MLTMVFDCLHSGRSHRDKCVRKKHQQTKKRLMSVVITVSELLLFGREFTCILVILRTVFGPGVEAFNLPKCFLSMQDFNLSQVT